MSDDNDVLKMLYKIEGEIKVLVEKIDTLKATAEDREKRVRAVERKLNIMFGAAVVLGGLLGGVGGRVIAAFT